jgi:hypothetical protein
MKFTTPNKLTSSISLGYSFTWAILGNIVYAACQWGMLVVLAKMGTPVMLGQFTLGLAITAPIILFLNLQLKIIQATDANQKYSFSIFLCLRLLTAILAFLLIICALIVGGYKGQVAAVIVCVGIAKSVESISDIFYGLLQQHEQLDIISKSMIFKGLLSIIALTAGIYFTQNIVLSTTFLAISWMVVLVMYDIPNGILIKRKNIIYDEVIKDFFLFSFMNGKLNSKKLLIFSI